MGFGEVRESLVSRAGAGVNIVPIARRPEGGVELAMIPRLADTLRKLKPDVVHVHNWSTSLYGIAAARLAGVPQVIYGLGGRNSSAPPSGRRQAVMRALTPHVDQFTAVCGYLKDYITDYWGAPNQQVQVLWSGVELQKIDDVQPRAQVRAQLQLPEDALVVGAISVLRPVKRIPDMIDAVARVAKDNPKVHLLLVGNAVGVSIDSLKERAEQAGLAGRCHFKDRTEHPHSLLPAFDVVMNTSGFEGASNAIFEAMAARIPVVATRVGGTPELIEEGQEGFLAQPGDVGRLAEAVSKLVSQPQLRRELGARGRARIEARHTVEGMIDGYLELYRRFGRMPAKSDMQRRIGSVSSLLNSVRAVARIK